MHHKSGGKSERWPDKKHMVFNRVSNGHTKRKTLGSVRIPPSLAEELLGHSVPYGYEVRALIQRNGTESMVLIVRPMEGVLSGPFGPGGLT